MPVKLFGVALLSIAVMLPGFFFDERLSERKRYLRYFSELVKRLPLSMLDGGDNIFDILRAESDPAFSFLSSIDSETINDKDILTELFKANRIGDSDSEVLADFFYQLGLGSKEQQEIRCEIFSKRLTALWKSAEETAEKSGRLYKIMSVSLGLVVFIILI